MVRTLTLSTIVVLALGAVASADLEQGQNWTVGTISNLQWQTGSGQLSAFEIAHSDNSQFIVENGSLASESMDVSIINNATTDSSNPATAGVATSFTTQGLGITSGSVTLGPGQQQGVVGSTGLVSQFQGVVFDGSQVLDSANGEGEAETFANYGLDLRQLALNEASVGNQSMELEGEQKSEAESDNTSATYGVLSGVVLSVPGSYGTMQLQESLYGGDTSQQEQYSLGASQGLTGVGNGEAESTNKVDFEMSQMVGNDYDTFGVQSSSLFGVQHTEVEGCNSASNGTATSVLIGEVQQYQNSFTPVP